MTPTSLVEAAILLRRAELHDMGLLLEDGRSATEVQRWARRDPLAWIMRICELQRLIELGRCLPVLSMVAGIVPEEPE